MAIIFFANVIKHLNIKTNDEHLSDTENLTDNVNIVIQRFKNHPSIVAISHLVTRKDNFCFNQVTYEKIEKLLRNLDTKKAFQNTDILTRLIKENSDLFTHFILKNY